MDPRRRWRHGAPGGRPGGAEVRQEVGFPSSPKGAARGEGIPLAGLGRRTAGHEHVEPPIDGRRGHPAYGGGWDLSPMALGVDHPGPARVAAAVVAALLLIAWRKARMDAPPFGPCVSTFPSQPRKAALAALPSRPGNA
jgi:hypothetical protein